MKKVLISLLVVLFILVLGTGLTACANDKDPRMEMFKYVSRDGAYVITGINDKTATEIVIPSCVSTIARAAFQDCRNLTSVIIQDGVTSIGELAFADCENLTSITIPDRATLPSLHPQNNYCTL